MTLRQRGRYLALAGTSLALMLPATASAADCGRELTPLVTQLERMDETLDHEGMYYTDYSAAVKRAIRAHRRIDVPGLDYACLGSVGVPAEKALNRYITAKNIWAGFYVQGRKVSPAKTRQMQRLWDQAAVFITRALRGL